MDIYSASKRLSTPFEITKDPCEESFPIDARALIGDGTTSALVRVDGVIDWACFPRFDSPSVFAAMLDPEAGGMMALQPVARPFRSLQRYEPDTNVIESLFEVPGQGVVRVLDYMPHSNDPAAAFHEIHRRVQCLEGTVEMRAIFDPRFDYGRGHTSCELAEHGVLALGPNGERMVAVLGGRAVWSLRARGGAETTFRMVAGERRWMVASWDSPKPEPIAAYRAYEHLRTTRQTWRDWLRTIDYDGPWRHHVLRSALLLKLLVHEPTGAMVAAPTTSLPEWLGGARNWDYRYVWPRDAAMAIRASNLIGANDEARDFFHFIRVALHKSKTMNVMYAVDAEPVPEEQILSHLQGFGGSAPVRIGNDARHQLQLDPIGAVVDAAYLYERFGGQLPLRTWRQIRDVVEGLTEGWAQADDGIWEPRGRRRHNVHSKVMCWLAFDRAARLAPRFGHHATAKRWQRAAELVHNDIRRNGVDDSGRYFKASYEGDHVDGSLLVLPIHGFMDADHPAMSATVRRVQAELGDGPFVYRYRIDDGVGGAEGAFVLCGFWLAEALAMMGRIEEAQEIFTAHAESSNHAGLLAEEIDPRTRTQLGNFPQAFSHLGLINAAVRIDLAMRMRDEGLDEVPHLTSWIQNSRS